MKKFSKFIVEKNITKDIFDFVGEKGEKVYDTMMKVAKKNKIKVMKPKNQSKARMGGDHIQISGDENAVNDLIKKYVGEDAKQLATAEEARVTSTAFRKKTARVNPMTQKDIERMVKDRKYKGNTSKLMKDVEKKFPDEYESDIVQNMMKKHAETNESTIGYGKAMVKKQRDQKKAMISKKDKNTLGKLAALMAKQPKRKT